MSSSKFSRTGEELDILNSNQRITKGNLTGESIPAIFVIPDAEEIINGPNYLEALNRQGVGNQLTSKVWWDKD